MLGVGASKKTYLDDVFSTHLYIGNETAARNINNGIDFANNGGMVWFKPRDESWHHRMWDTERGATQYIYPNRDVAGVADANGQDSSMFNAFNNNGFQIAKDDSYAGTNYNNQQYASWSFRKAPGFFTIKEYTGTGSTQSLTHDLDSIPGCIMVKRTDTTADWGVYHRGQNGGVDPEDYRLKLNSNTTQNNDTYWGDTAPTATHFTVGDSHSEVNASGGTYIAYILSLIHI